MAYENEHRPQKETLSYKREQESLNPRILGYMGNHPPSKDSHAWWDRTFHKRLA